MNQAIHGRRSVGFAAGADRSDMYAETMFWGSLAFAAYVYLGYPLLLALWSRLAPRPVHKRYCEPTVTMIIAAYNERHNIRARIRNCLQLDYPKEKLEIIVSLDGPTDGTDAVVKPFESAGIRILHSPVHRGKAAAINRALRSASGDILVFGDTRQAFAPNAIRELVANFADPNVGAVSGELMLLDDSGSEASDAVGLYWRYEKRLRMMEGRIHSLLGVTGAIYALRREIAEPLPPDVILDDVMMPMRALLRGQRVVFDGAARAFDRVARSPEAEYHRKLRTLIGNYQLISRMPELLLPWRNPVCLQFVSHKVGRLLAPYAIFGLGVSNLFLDGYYLIPLAAQGVWYSLVLAGLLVSRASRPKTLPERALMAERSPEA
jgi:cellulose synthase/poly-beta-1,6-N-acetylglucosamine synthase-like glycosyltransferase